MDTGLDNIPYTIVEPWTDDESGVVYYLHDMGLKFSMRAVAGDTSGSSAVIYSAKITSQDALAIKLIFPEIHVYPSIFKEKVSI